MKKILAIILVIGCVLSFAACNLFKKDNERTDDASDIPAIQAKIDASAPISAEINVVLKSSLGNLNGVYNVTYNEDGTAFVSYSYEQFNKFEEGSSTTELKSTVTGNTTVSADGKVADSIGGVASVEAVSFDIKLDENKLESVKIDAGALSAKIKAADTEAVLGVALAYDVDIIITTGSNGVTAIAISYTTTSGPVEINASYSYPVPEVEEEGEESAE